jgi:hypothetical protein
MAEIEITFHNKISLRTQAQIFIERTLISTGVVAPGESCILLAEPGRYDIYLKNGVTGWELAHKLDSEAKTVTLSLRKGRYIVS